jgi:enterochelin esterase-like enzyme
MKNSFFTLCLFMFYNSFSQAPSLAKVSTGTIQHFNNFPSKFVAARNVDVWLPNGYNPNKKYAVLYMHDGQMLFDSTTTWNKQYWGVAETMATLIDQQKIPPCIVVGVWNSGTTRHLDYFPQKPFEMLTQYQQDTLLKANRPTGAPVFSSNIQSDNYLRFLVTELKPFIDSSFSTYKKRKHTFIAGSSMGGLISMYAICQYPNVFGGAGCLSTHWPGIFATQNNPIPAAFMQYLQAHLPKPKKHKIYFDYGTATLDAMYEPYQQQANEIMKAKGYTPKHWITKKFEGAAHTETAWRKRLDGVLLFLMGW